MFLSVALGVSAIETGVRLLPLSLTLLVSPSESPSCDRLPRRVVRLGFVVLFAGLVLLVALLDVGAGPEIVTWRLLLVGAGLGAMASQLGRMTVSSVPDEQSGEVGGVQNTGTQLGASIGTALAGAILISALTASTSTHVVAPWGRGAAASYGWRQRRSMVSSSSTHPTEAGAMELSARMDRSRWSGRRAFIHTPRSRRQPWGC